jgi:H+/Cl- antiporter ClcA
MLGASAVLAATTQGPFSTSVLMKEPPRHARALQPFDAGTLSSCR